MNINSQSTENLLFTQKLLQELPENKKLNLSEKQKTAFQKVLTEALLKSSDIKNLSDLQDQLILKDPKLFNMINLNNQNDFLNLLDTKLNKTSNLSNDQIQLLKSLNLTSEGSISPSSKILISELTNSNLKQVKSQVGNNNAIKTKAKTSYQQQIPINLRTNMGGMFSRIEQITSNFFV